MNHQNPSHDDLGAALHEVADGVGRFNPIVDDNDFATNVRLQTKAVRRRRRAQHTGIAAACVLLVAAGGVIVAQNLPNDDPSMPIATAPTTTSSAPFPQCGASADMPDSEHSLEIVSEAHTDGGDPQSSSDTPWATDIGPGTFLPLQLKNAGEERLEVGSTGYATVVLVQDGRVVAGPGAMPEPYTSPILEPGDSTPVSATLPEPCDGADLPDGDYEAYAILDASISTPDAEESPTNAKVYGGPWAVRLGESPRPPEAMSLQCGDEVREIPQFTDPIRTEVTLPDDGAAHMAGFDDRNVRLNFRNAGNDRQHVTGERIELYVVADGKVIASAATEEPLDLTFEPGKAAGNDYYPEFPNRPCQGDGDVPEGTYELYTIVNFTDVGSGDLVESITGPTAVKIIRGPEAVDDGAEHSLLDELDLNAEFPQCGAAVPQEDDSVFALLTQEPIEALPHRDGTFEVPIALTNVTRDRLLGNRPTYIEAVLVRDGRVLSRLPSGETDAEHFDLKAGGSVTMPLRVGLTSCSANGGALTPSGYEVWAVAAVNLKERQLPDGTSESASDVVPAVVKLTKGTIPLG